MNARDRQILLHLKRLLQERLKVHQVILFGSRARGDAVEESDMDVLVVLDQPIDRETRRAVSESTWLAGFDAGVVVSAVLYSRHEWEDGPERYSPLAEAVRSDGVLV